MCCNCCGFRTSIALPGQQSDLIEGILTIAAGKPVVLSVMAGGAVCLAKYKDDPRVSSILYVGYPGQSGGTGLADVVFGRYNPSGRLTQTFYAEKFVDEVSFLDMHMRPGHNNPGRGYRFYNGESVVYPFGSGLSYTQFTYEWASEELMKLDGQEYSVIIEISVFNVGSQYSGAESVLLFLEPPPESPAGSPMKILRNFEKIFLSPQQSELVIFKLTGTDFSLADSNGVFHVVPGDWTIVVGNLSKTITIL